MHLLGGDWEFVSCMMDHTVSFTSDYGTEARTTINVPAVSANMLFHHWDGNAVHTDTVGSLEDQCAILVSLSMQFALPVAGLEHMCCNAMKQIVSKMPDFDEWYKRANNFARVITNQYYTDRIRVPFLQSDDPTTQVMQRMIQVFDIIPEEGRFSNLMEFIDMVIPMKLLRRYVDHEQFQGPNEGKSDFGDLDLASQYIMDDKSWGTNLAIYALGCGWLSLQTYTRGCKCHRAKDVDGNSFKSYYTQDSI